jgi:hypothetical protein
MPSLKEPIGLWIVRSGVLNTSAESFGHMLLQRRGELRSPITGDVDWYAIPGDPSKEELLSAFSSGHSTEREHFWPSGIAIHHSQEITESPGAWQRAYNVHVDLAKWCVWHGNLLHLRLHM